MFGYDMLSMGGDSFYAGGVGKYALSGPQTFILAHGFSLVRLKKRLSNPPSLKHCKTNVPRRKVKNSRRKKKELPTLIIEER